MIIDYNYVDFTEHVYVFEKVPDDLTELGNMLVEWDSLPEISRVMNTSFYFYGTYCLGGQHADMLKKGNYIKAYCENDTWQFFRISNVKPNLETVSITARPIAFSANDNFIENCFTDNGSGQTIMGNIQNSLTFSQKVNYTSNVPTFHQFTAKEVKPLEAIWGSNNGQQNLVGVTGGELDFDNWNINLVSRIGKDSGYSIDFGINLEAIESEFDDESIVNSLYLVGGTEENDYDENKEPIVYKYLTIEGINDENRRIAKRENTECKTEEDLKKWGQSLFDKDRIHEPKSTHTVSMVMLEYTEEYYELYETLHRLHFGDTAQVYNEKYDQYYEERLFEYVWYPTLKKFKSIVLGSAGKRYTAAAQTETQILQSKIENKTSMVIEAIRNATGWITGTTGGYVRLRPEKAPQEILIMDKPVASEAKKVWRWNLGGLGYSSTGVDGEYGTAITQDGAIVANYITAGILSGILIQGVAIKTMDDKDFQVVMEGGKLSFEKQVTSTGLSDVHGEELGTISATYGSSGNINGFAVIQDPGNIFSINTGSDTTANTSTAIFQVPADSTSASPKYRLIGSGTIKGDVVFEGNVEFRKNVEIKGELTINGEKVYPGQSGGPSPGGDLNAFVRVLELTAKYEMGNQNSGYYHEPLNDGAGWNYGKYSFTQVYEMDGFLSWLGKNYPAIRSQLTGAVGSTEFNNSWSAFGANHDEQFTQVQAEYFCRLKLKPKIESVLAGTGVNFNDGNKWLGTVGLMASIVNWYPASVSSGGFFYRHVQQFASNWSDSGFITAVCDYIVANASSMVGAEYVEGIQNRFRNEKVDALARTEKVYLPFDGVTSNRGLEHIRSLLGQTVGNGECYALPAEYSGYLGGCGLGAGTKYGLSHVSGNGSTSAASDIGIAYNWSEVGWTVITNPRYDQLKVGAILCWKRGGQVAGWTASAEYGHTGVIRGLSGGKIQTYEQNTEKGRIFGELERDYIAVGEIASIIIPPR